MEKATKNTEILSKVKEDLILDHAIYYAINGVYTLATSVRRRRVCLG